MKRGRGESERKREIERDVRFDRASCHRDQGNAYVSIWHIHTHADMCACVYIQRDREIER